MQAKPASLRFNCSANGKPALAGEFAGAGVHINLAHSEDLALVAVTRIGAIGVDVECIRPVREMDELVARFFSARETVLFQKLRLDEKATAFFNLWTRKEALLKATGEGIPRSLSLVEVSFLPGRPARLLAIGGDASKAAEWAVCNLSPAPGFIGAIAIKAQNLTVQCGTWDSAEVR
jgi:4'-phosphopantetheinyl transferase